MYSSDKVEDASNYRLNQDPKIADIFEQAWGAAPDSSSIHHIPSWGVLCNLCSEAHVLFDDDGNPL